MKAAAASPALRRHRGRAVVFENMADLKARIDSPELPVDADSVLILKNAGPIGGPGMPEWGQLPIPRKLLEAGVRDMVRISDARMSGTSYGACVLHASPEAAAGGPLGLARDGDEIELDVPNRTLTLHVDDAELESRRANWQAPEHNMIGGYQSLYINSVTQADQGCDLEFLHGKRGAAVPRESH